MQTIYATTTHFIRHQGNMVDLEEFRRKRALVREGSLAPRLEPGEAPAPVVTVLPAVPRRRRSRRARMSWALDAGASLGIIVMTLSFAIQALI